MANFQDALGWTEEQVQDLRATGYSYLIQGMYEKAKIFFEGLVAMDPNHAYDTQTLAALYLQLKDERALEWLDRALDLNPTHIPTLLNKAKVLVTTGKLNEGLDLARTLAPTSSVAEALVMAYG